MKNVLKILGIIVVVAVLIALSFALTSALIYGICWAFGFQFTWKIAFGVWLALILVRSCFKLVISKAV